MVQRAAQIALLGLLRHPRNACSLCLAWGSSVIMIKTCIRIHNNILLIIERDNVQVVSTKKSNSTFLDFSMEFDITASHFFFNVGLLLLNQSSSVTFSLFPDSPAFFIILFLSVKSLSTCDLKLFVYLFVHQKSI